MAIETDHRSRVDEIRAAYEDATFAGALNLLTQGGGDSEYEVRDAILRLARLVADTPIEIAKEVLASNGKVKTKGESSIPTSVDHLA